MISSQTIQTSIDELKAITKVDLSVYDPTGMVVASTTSQDDIAGGLISGFASSPADSQVIGQHHLLKILDEGELLYILVAKGMSDDVYMVGKIASFRTLPLPIRRDLTEITFSRTFYWTICFWWIFTTGRRSCISRWRFPERFSLWKPIWRRTALLQSF